MLPLLTSETQCAILHIPGEENPDRVLIVIQTEVKARMNWICLLYTSDAADDLLCVDLGGRRLIKKKTQNKQKKQNLAQSTKYKH